MDKSFKFWWNALAGLQLFTAVAYSLGFFTKFEGSNATESELFNLMTSYKMDMGAGFTPTMYQVLQSLSACFVLLCLMAASMNFYLWNKKVSARVLKGIAGINVLMFGACFFIMIFYSFLPPIILTGLILIFAIGSYIAAGRRLRRGHI